MNELYEAIEKKIKDAGYPRNISGADVYDVIRLTERIMESIFCCLNLKMT